MVVSPLHEGIYAYKSYALSAQLVPICFVRIKSLQPWQPCTARQSTGSSSATARQNTGSSSATARQKAGSSSATAHQNAGSSSAKVPLGHQMRALPAASA